jgi:hypothetical protein
MKTKSAGDSHGLHNPAASIQSTQAVHFTHFVRKSCIFLLSQVADKWFLNILLCFLLHCWCPVEKLNHCDTFWCYSYCQFIALFCVLWLHAMPVCHRSKSQTSDLPPVNQISPSGTTRVLDQKFTNIMQSPGSQCSMVSDWSKFQNTFVNIVVQYISSAFCVLIFSSFHSNST